MNRRQFIESHGATCKNWNWSWSFINEAKKLIIFGAWDRDNEGERARIFTEEWRVNSEGKKNAGYKQSREHVRLIEEEGYQLMTFPMKYSNERKSEDGAGPAKIAGFVEALTPKHLTRVGNTWYASDGTTGNTLPEELTDPEKYPEGAKKTVTINAFERNPKARKACIAHHGVICVVCGFNFQKVYGPLGEGFIHVHHIKPIGSIGEEYEVDPVKDLIPVCPNCHAMIHRANPPLEVEQLQTQLKETRNMSERIAFSSDALWCRPKADNGDSYIWGSPKSQSDDPAWSKRHIIYRWVRRSDNEIAVIGEAERTLSERINNYISAKDESEAGPTNKRVFAEQENLVAKGDCLYLEYLDKMEGFDFTQKTQRRGAEGLLTAHYKPYCHSQFSELPT